MGGRGEEGMVCLRMLISMCRSVGIDGCRLNVEYHVDGVQYVVVCCCGW